MYSYVIAIEDLIKTHHTKSKSTNNGTVKIILHKRRYQGNFDDSSIKAKRNTIDVDDANKRPFKSSHGSRVLKQIRVN